MNLQEAANKLREQNDVLHHRIDGLEAEAREAARNVGLIHAKEAEIERLAHETALLREEVDGAHETKATLEAALRRQQDLESEGGRLRAELQGREKALARVEETLAAQIAKADAGNEKSQTALEQLRQQLLTSEAGRHEEQKGNAGTAAVAGACKRTGGKARPSVGHSP